MGRGGEFVTREVHDGAVQCKHGSKNSTGWGEAAHRTASSSEAKLPMLPASEL